jgi:ureidoglycolate lyase
MRLQAVPLTPELFAPYGQVLMAEQGLPERKVWAADVDNRRPEARANMTYMSLEPEHYPVEVSELERHQFSHQMFVPLEGTNHLVVVCPTRKDGLPDLEKVIAFHATGGQTVNYNANVWHAPRMVLYDPGAFIMLRWDADTAADTELITIEQPVIVEAAENNS